MTTHETNQMYSCLELLRKVTQSLPDFKNSDWKDADDWIFSELNLTVGELQHIYAGQNQLAFFGSAIQQGMPMAPTYDELREIYFRAKKGNVRFLYMTEGSALGKMSVVKAVSDPPQLRDVYLITQADAPLLENIPDETEIILELNEQVIPPEVALYTKKDGEKDQLIFCVSP